MKMQFGSALTPTNFEVARAVLEEMLVRRAIGLTSSLRVEAPVFVPVLHCAAMRIVVARPGP